MRRGQDYEGGQPQNVSPYVFCFVGINQEQAEAAVFKTLSADVGFVQATSGVELNRDGAVI